MSNLDNPVATTSIRFHGADVRNLVRSSPAMTQAIRDMSLGMLDATINVYTQPRIADTEPMEWSMTISSPVGRRSLALIQRKPNSAVLITGE
jgi:hypothetical protein